MTLNDVITLANAGFTAQQIAQLAQMQPVQKPVQEVQQPVQQSVQPVQPVQPVQQPVQPMQQPVQQPVQQSDPFVAIQQQMQQLTQTVLNSAVTSSQQPPEQTADDILYAVLIEPNSTK